MTTIYASVENEHISISKRPLIASGGVRQCRIVFTFNDYWNNLTRSAIFADHKKERFLRIPLESDGSAMIPWEVLTQKGVFWLGVEGVSGSTRYTSELIRYNIVEGTHDGGDPQPPSPDVYARMLDDLGKVQSDVKSVRGDVEQIQDDITGIQGDISGIQEDISGIQGDISGIQEDISGIQKDVSGIQGEVSGIQKDVTGIQGDVSGIQKNVTGIQGDVSGIQGDVSDIRDNVSDLQADVTGIQDQLNDLSNDGIEKIVRFASFDKVRAITITDSVNVDATALIYNGYDYHTFQHDFSIPIVDSGEITPVITEDGNHFAFKLSKNINTNTAELERRLDDMEQQFTDLSGTVGSLSDQDSVPEYYKSMLETKEAQIQQTLGLAGRNRAAFLFLTDLHWSTNHGNSPALIRHLLDHTPINMVVCGGDILNSTPTDKETALQIGKSWQDAFSFCRDRMYTVYGRSDRNCLITIDDENTLTEQEIFTYLQAGSDARNMVYGNYYSFYVDNAMEKTRYLFLDSGRYKITYDCAKFAVQALTSLEEGWNCIVISNVFQYVAKAGDPTSATPHSDTKNVLYGLLDDYNDRLASAINFYSSGTLLYNFGEGKGTVTACFGGCLHFDKSSRTKSGIPIMQFDCDGVETLSDVPATAGTVNEQVVTAVIVDYDHNQIHCIRIGRGSDLTMDISA